MNLEIYPNPTSGRFTLRTGQEGSGIVQLFNAMGQKVYQTMVQAYDSRDIDLSHLGSGVYILRLQGDKETHTRQVIVNR